MTANHHPQRDTSVLIVGGGLAGLSAALFLAWRGVPTLLVERHARSSLHPRAIGFTTRTLELLRVVGLDAKIPQLPEGHGRPRRVVVESLAGIWGDEVAWTPPERTPTSGESSRSKASDSPCTGAAIAQDRLEPLLRDRAIELGADVHMSTELVSFRQSEDGVLAVVRSRDGVETTLRADYMIAADGHRSPVREALGIARSGHGFMRVVRSVLFRAELDAYLKTGVSQFVIDRPDLKGMLTTYRDGRWLLMLEDDEERDERALRALVRRAIGRDDVAFELITTGRWELSALIADRFSLGRVFLIGDAAHTLPPARGGYGANTGIEDAFNLAWKLEAVTKGSSTPALLASYDAERRPIAWLRHGQIFARQDYAAEATAEEKRVAILDDDAMELGQLYRSNVVLGADASLPPAQRPSLWAGQPGTRAPHLWLTCEGAPRSTLDLLQRSWLLVTEDTRWLAAAQTASECAGVELRCLLVAATTNAALTVSPPRSSAAIDAPNQETEELELFRSDFREAFGLTSSGASLVRPDGYIAWRSREWSDDATTALSAALTVAACSPACDPFSSTACDSPEGRKYTECWRKSTR